MKVLGQAECEARKMGAYLAVAQGSKDGPEFIHLSYKPKGGAWGGMAWHGMACWGGIVGWCAAAAAAACCYCVGRGGGLWMRCTCRTVRLTTTLFSHIPTTPGPAKPKKLVLIGKGLTFDSGGYNLKAGAGSMIELMKFDMGGAGAVLGAAKALAEMAPTGECMRA